MLIFENKKVPTFYFSLFLTRTNFSKPKKTKNCPTSLFLDSLVSIDRSFTKHVHTFSFQNIPADHTNSFAWIYHAIVTIQRKNLYARFNTIFVRECFCWSYNSFVWIHRTISNDSTKMSHLPLVQTISQYQSKYNTEWSIITVPFQHEFHNDKIYFSLTKFTIFHVYWAE